MLFMFSFASSSFAAFSADISSFFFFIILYCSSIVDLRISSLRSRAFLRSTKRFYYFSIISAVLAYNSSYFCCASLALSAASFYFCAFRLDSWNFRTKIWGITPVFFRISSNRRLVILCTLISTYCRCRTWKTVIFLLTLAITSLNIVEKFGSEALICFRFYNYLLWVGVPLVVAEAVSAEVAVRGQLQQYQVAPLLKDCPHGILSL